MSAARKLPSVFPPLPRRTPIRYDDPRYISGGEAAELLGVSRATVNSYAVRGGYEREHGKILRTSFYRAHPSIAQGVMLKAMRDFALATVDTVQTVDTILAAMQEITGHNKDVAQEAALNFLNAKRLPQSPRPAKPAATEKY